MGIKFTTMDKSLNFQPSRVKDFDAIELSVYKLISTPIGSLPEFPYLGFALEDFLHLSETSTEFGNLAEEFKSKVQELIKNDNIEVNVTRENPEVVEITISYRVNNAQTKSIPLSVYSENGNTRILFRDIIVR